MKWVKQDWSQKTISLDEILSDQYIFKQLSIIGSLVKTQPLPVYNKPNGPAYGFWYNEMYDLITTELYDCGFDEDLLRFILSCWIY